MNKIKIVSYSSLLGLIIFAIFLVNSVDAHNPEKRNLIALMPPAVAPDENKLEGQVGPVTTSGPIVPESQADKTPLPGTAATGGTAAFGSFSYKLLESIPGIPKLSQGETPDFNTYVSGIYQFLIMIVGICALFMITVGGYMYITSAGNNATMGKAKSIITDAIIGLVLALLSYLIFYTINPNLTNPSGLQPISSLGAGVGAGVGAGAGVTGGLSNYNDAEVRTKLKALGADVKETNTNVAGLTDNTIALAGRIGGVITGGTENIAHNPEGAHPEGRAIDVRLTPEVKQKVLEEIKNNPNISQVCAQDPELRKNCSEAVARKEPTNTVHIAL